MRINRNRRLFLVSYLTLYSLCCNVEQSSAFSPSKGYPLAVALASGIILKIPLNPGLSHEDITTQSLIGPGTGIANELFNVSTPSKSMKDAVKEIADSNAQTDKNQSSYLH